eukprot:354234-Chlamydomonas_euryale.AAC.7
MSVDGYACMHARSHACMVVKSAELYRVRKNCMVVRWCMGLGRIAWCTSSRRTAPCASPVCMGLAHASHYQSYPCMQDGSASIMPARESSQRVASRDVADFGRPHKQGSGLTSISGRLASSCPDAPNNTLAFPNQNRGNSRASERMLSRFQVKSQAQARPRLGCTGRSTRLPGRHPAGPRGVAGQPAGRPIRGGRQANAVVRTSVRTRPSPRLRSLRSLRHPHHPKWRSSGRTGASVVTFPGPVPGPGQSQASPRPRPVPGQSQAQASPRLGRSTGGSPSAGRHRRRPHLRPQPRLRSFTPRPRSCSSGAPQEV